MFRHQGKKRTYIHHLKLASLLSFVAGIVNIAGVLALKILTTNVTGHFAFFSEELFKGDYKTCLVYLAFIVSFLLGAFMSNLLIETGLRYRPSTSYIVPMVIEAGILSFAAFGDHSAIVSVMSVKIIACILLFAMGLQNALVTKVSQSVVRTTHLTGLFTDLGIELSQLFFYKKTEEFQKLKKNIALKMVIIGCFFSGCVIGGYLYGVIKLKNFLFTAICVLIALLYDSIRLRYHFGKKKSLPKA